MLGIRMGEIRLENDTQLCEANPETMLQSHTCSWWPYSILKRNKVEMELWSYFCFVRNLWSYSVSGCAALVDCSKRRNERRESVGKNWFSHVAALKLGLYSNRRSVGANFMRIEEVVLFLFRPVYCRVSCRSVETTFQFRTYRIVAISQPTRGYSTVSPVNSVAFGKM